MLPELLLSLVVSTSTASGLPNPDMTPGDLCTPSDPDYVRTLSPSGLDQIEIPLCRRHVTAAKKRAVERAYGLPDDARGYIIDHRIPLCAGGNNDVKNLWPQAASAARDKDRFEDAVCADLRHGVFDAAEAIDMVMKWVPTPVARGRHRGR